MGEHAAAHSWLPRSSGSKTEIDRDTLSPSRTRPNGLLSPTCPVFGIKYGAMSVHEMEKLSGSYQDKSWTDFQQVIRMGTLSCFLQIGGYLAQVKGILEGVWGCWKGFRQQMAKR